MSKCQSTICFCRTLKRFNSGSIPRLHPPCRAGTTLGCGDREHDLAHGLQRCFLAKLIHEAELTEWAGIPWVCLAGCIRSTRANPSTQKPTPHDYFWDFKSSPSISILAKTGWDWLIDHSMPQLGHGFKASDRCATHIPAGNLMDLLGGNCSQFITQHTHTHTHMWCACTVATCNPRCETNQITWQSGGQMFLPMVILVRYKAWRLENKHHSQLLLSDPNNQWDNQTQW